MYIKIATTENELISIFDLKMDKLAQKKDVSYLNLINSSTKFIFTDGVHLNKDSAKEVSLEVEK